VNQETVAVAGPMVFTPQLSADERRFLDGIKVMSSRSLYSFNKFVLKRSRLIDRVHRPYNNFLTSAVFKKYGLPQPPPITDWSGGDCSNGDYTRITRDACRPFKLDLMPRATYKSTNGTLGMSLWLPAEIDPNCSVMPVFGSQPLSDTQADEIEQHIMLNARFRYLYGKWEEGSTNWTKRSKTYSIRKQPSRTPSLMMTSVGADITGLHPTAIILDDPINEKNYDSEVELAAIERFFDALFALDPDFMWVHGTRWGPTDLYGQRIIGELWDYFDIYVRAAKNPDGSLWFPELLTEEKLAAKLKVMGRFLFASQMMNQVVSRSDKPLMSENIKAFEKNDAPSRDKMTVLLWCDPSGARQTGHWGIPVLGLTRNQDDDDVEIWILDYVKAPLTSKKAAETFCDMWWKYRPDACGCENTGFSQSFIDDTLIPAMMRSGIPNRLVQTKPGATSKPARVFKVENSFGTLLERSRVHIQREAHAFRSEIAMFPSGTYDLLDSTAAALKFAYEHDFFPARAKREEVRTTSDDYQRVLDDANRVLGEERRKMRIYDGVNQGDHILSAALRKTFRDASPRKQEEQHVHA